MSDRVLLRVRCARSGRREWHDADGISLVWQGDRWIARRSPVDDGVSVGSEIEALDYALADLRDLRDQARFGELRVEPSEPEMRMNLTSEYRELERRR
jgi:hypothetical protein